MVAMATMSSAVPRVVVIEACIRERVEGIEPS
jgi:hypothetical protein